MNRGVPSSSDLLRQRIDARQKAITAKLQAIESLQAKNRELFLQLKSPPALSPPTTTISLPQSPPRYTPSSPLPLISPPSLPQNPPSSNFTYQIQNPIQIPQTQNLETQSPQTKHDIRQFQVPLPLQNLDPQQFPPFRLDKNGAYEAISREMDAKLEINSKKDSAEKSIQLDQANRRGHYEDPLSQTTEFIFERIRCGFHEIRNAVCDIVEIVRLPNAPLVVHGNQATSSSPTYLLLPLETSNFTGEFLILQFGWNQFPREGIGDVQIKLNFVITTLLVNDKLVLNLEIHIARSELCIELTYLIISYKCIVSLVKSRVLHLGMKLGRVFDKEVVIIVLKYVHFIELNVLELPVKYKEMIVVGKVLDKITARNWVPNVNGEQSNSFDSSCCSEVGCLLCKFLVIERIRKLEHSVFVVSQTHERVCDMIKRRTLRTRAIKLLLRDLHCRRQEVLMVGTGRRVLKMYSIEVRKCEKYSAEEPLVYVTFVLFEGEKLQPVTATIALERAGISGFFNGQILRQRDKLFWFTKPELLFSLIHLILFRNAFASFIAILVMRKKQIMEDGKTMQLLDTNFSRSRRAPRFYPKVNMVLKLCQGSSETMKWAERQVNALDEIAATGDEQSPTTVQSFLNLTLLNLADNSLSSSIIDCHLLLASGGSSSVRSVWNLERRSFFPSFEKPMTGARLACTGWGYCIVAVQGWVKLPWPPPHRINFKQIILGLVASIVHRTLRTRFFEGEGNVMKMEQELF